MSAGSAAVNANGNTSGVDGCFGKIRTASSVDAAFRESMDRMSKVARLDKIDELLRQKIPQLCTEAEAAEAKAFLDAEQPSVQIARSVASNLTNEEKDRLNFWQNLNDTFSERAFFLSKYENLPKEQYGQLTKSFSDVLNKFVGSDLKSAIAHFLTQLTPTEQYELKKYGAASEEEKLVTLVDDKLKAQNVSTVERDEIKGYVKGLFLSPKSD
ncbi:hypothetical protein Tcan_18647 [Toxocara canis]|nr:hypothetical protein Tcan_18647 [Toxocara canis]